MKESRANRRGREPFADDMEVVDLRRDAVGRQLESLLTGIDARMKALHSSDGDVNLLLTHQQARRQQPSAFRKMNEKVRNKAQRQRNDELKQLKCARDEIAAALDCLHDEDATKEETMQRLLGAVRALLPAAARDANRLKDTGKAGRANAVRRAKVLKPIYAKANRMALDLRAHDDAIRSKSKNWKRPAMWQITYKLTKDDLQTLGFPERLTKDDRTRLTDRLVIHLPR